MKFKIFIVCLFFTNLIVAQTKGTLTGIITDKENKNAPLQFANILVKENSKTTTTDDKGKYSISLSQGTYKIVYSFVGYENIEKTISIVSNETLNQNISLGSGNFTLKDVVIKSIGSRDKETAILLDQKKAIEIKQSIGAQEMSRKGVSDVEEGLTKITGITKVESRGLFVRGLEDRYNNLLLNDLASPTNNPFTKIIPLDLFPTDIVSVIDVFKTFNPNIYGDFAGGTFNVLTSTGSKSITKVNIGTGYTTNNSLSKFLISEEANTTKGFLGYNGQERELPSIVGNSPTSYTFSAADSQKYLKSGFNANETKSPLNTSIGVLHSEKFTFKNANKFSYLLSLNFDNNYAIRSGADRTIDIQSTGYRYVNDFITTEYIYKNSVTSLLGLNYSTSRLKLGANLFYINTANNSIKDQLGVSNSNVDDPNRLIRTNELTKSKYLNAQLLGEIALTESKTQNLKFGASFANTQYSQPDRKFFQGLKTENMINTNYNGTNFLRQYLTIDGNSFFAGLAEYSLKFGKNGNKIIIGYNGNQSEMETSYRFLQAENAGSASSASFNSDLSVIDTQIQNDLALNNFRYVENSNATYKVKLKEATNSGYGNLVLKFENKWEINGGVRIENSTRETKFRKLGSQIAPFEIKKYDNLYILPSLNIKYEVTEKANIRLAGSKTYTRPVIMESFPLAYLNADGTSIQGNPILKNSDNINVDLKFEIFPTNKELFAIGAFGKSIKNPIEKTFITNATTSTITSFLNSESADLYGLETEFILSLERLNKHLSDFTLGFNASYMSTDVKVNPIYSTQDEDGIVTNNKSIETFKDRELQGASKWILNSDLKYQFNFNKKISNTISLVYSVFSKRIFAVGTNGQDHTYELPFQKLDLVWSSKLSDHLDLKFSADNILNPSREREFGNNGTYKINEKSFTNNSFKRGVGFALTLGYTF